MICFVLFSEHPSTQSKKKFFPAWQGVTDYGACCLIPPYLSFVNKETKDIDPKYYTGNQWLSQPKGSQSGQIGGIEFFLDVEGFDYSHNGNDSVGFRFVFVEQSDKPMLKQDGYLISPGK